ncbi:hypothetical protein CHS0354_002770 [Potamilus streckersoni]|uniref:ceramide glucosyltransferase n=1 Tax=Potamilus streckersoni TaxID=2493646 RepID=A0AAE0VYU2_9BIVA|nr:hypothetical protein CHS0354_002770 [Potamilus streckersoni]
MTMLGIIDEQTQSYIIFFLAIIGILVYGVSVFFMIVSFFWSHVYLHRKPDCSLLSDSNMPGVSIIKPLMGVDPLLEINLESHFLMDYPKFELLFCVQDEQDEAITLVNKLCEKYPKVDVRLFIGGRDGIINPMVHNMAPAYDNAKYDLVWISTSRIKSNTDIILDMICKLQKPNVAVCHQMPFYLDQKGFAATVEKIYFGGAMARYYLGFNAVNLCCCTGMSYMFKKPLLDELNGLNWYGRYLAEDYFLTKALHDKGYRLVVSAFPAQQNVVVSSVCGYKDRMVRWLRLRLNMMPLVSGVVEPLSECIALGLYGAWCAHYFLNMNFYIFFGAHIGTWILYDYFQLRAVNNGPVMFSKIEFLLAWIVRELLAIWIFIEAILSPRTVKWGRHTYRVTLGGHTEVLKNKSKVNLS